MSNCSPLCFKSDYNSVSFDFLDIVMVTKALKDRRVLRPVISFSPETGYLSPVLLIGILKNKYVSCHHICAQRGWMFTM